LHDLQDPPVEIFCIGHLEALQLPSLAIVGSRKASQQGLRHAHDFAKSLANMGVCIVSGLAEGVDAAAHMGALDSQLKCCTIAVCGTSLDRCYPIKNRALSQKIAEKGLLISEHPIGTITKPYHFPQRNRLIAALSLGTLVVEANQKSGSLITARFANDLGREIFAIPNAIERISASGCHQLIKDGAKLTERPADIAEELVFKL
jgi:DNA processing protein